MIFKNWNGQGSKRKLQKFGLKSCRHLSKSVKLHCSFNNRLKIIWTRNRRHSEVFSLLQAQIRQCDQNVLDHQHYYDASQAAIDWLTLIYIYMIYDSVNVLYTIFYRPRFASVTRMYRTISTTMMHHRPLLIGWPWWRTGSACVPTHRATDTRCKINWIVCRYLLDK